MYGGLKKSASRLALVAAAGALSTNAFAADLGGDCCADLEERVAELEATAARKGTRKTSLEVWGQVNKAVVGWNDGINKNTYLGIDDTNSSTRFGFRGNAKIAPSVSAGYSIIIEWASGARTFGISQFTDKNQLTTGAGALTNSVGGSSSASNNFGNNDAALSMRDANWWIESSNIGRLTVGRYDSHNSSLQQLIDLGGITTTAAGSNVGLASGSALVFRTNNALGATSATFTAGSNAPASAVQGVNSLAGFENYTKYSLGNTTDGIEMSPRINGAYYTSPTFQGFTAAGGVGGAAQNDSQCSNPGAIQGQPCTDNFNYGLFYSAVLKYANEFSGFRVAAAIATESSQETGSSIYANAGTSARPAARDTGFSLSLLHVPTGLFAQGYYDIMTRGHDIYNVNGTGALSGFANGTGANASDTAREFMVQVGIRKNWFGLGDTIPYAEYERTTNGYNTFGLYGSNAPSNALGNGAASVGGANANVVAYSGDVTTNKMWGVGLVQNIDAAAMSLYAGYKDYSLSSANCTAAGGCKDISTFIAGALIKF